MEKIKAVVFDVMGNALEWLDEYGDEEHLEICEVITLDDDSPIPIFNLPLYDNWDILLVFENGVRESVEIILNKISIPKEKVIYPLDMEPGNYVIASYIFRGSIRKLLRYSSYREDDYEYGICSVEGLTYINSIHDDIILPKMIFEQTNWAKDDMEEFFHLAKEYHSFDSEQVLFCDIGANIGTTCIYFKKNLDRDVKILAFEPSPDNYRLLRVNTILNEIDESECTFVKKGVSDKTSNAYFNYDPANPGASSVVTEESDDHSIIELITLDEYFESCGLDPNMIKYMWVDVEGFEARFLAGARNTLKNIDIPILMEFIPEFYMEKEGEFELLMNELKRNFSEYICIQDAQKRRMPIDDLWKEQGNKEIMWDLFLLK